ncbi:MAG: LysR family transcriptional regulator [Gemmataceae bacterium]|nr:LysR family transcriptional regulator [Gemmataceae bacterium]
MEMHQLRYFVAVAETANFTRAAERCHVSQPSLSQQIGKLEKRLHQRLFDRLGRRAVLTDAGRLLLDRARAILAAADDAERRLRDGADLGARLAVGVIPTVAPYLLPPALERFLRHCPGVEVTVHEDATRNLVEAAAGGELDLAILALPLSDDRLHVEPLRSEPLLLALPSGHRLARKKRVTVEDLAEERFILLTEMHCLGEQVLSFCRAGGCEPRIACRSAQIATVQKLIALGQGISLLPEMARRADVDARTVYRPLAGGPARTLAVAWHRHRYHSSAAERFLADVRALGETANGA